VFSGLGIVRAEFGFGRREWREFSGVLWGSQTLKVIGTTQGTRNKEKSVLISEVAECIVGC